MTKAKKSGSVSTLHIRNMVCDRCIRVVREELGRAGYDVVRVELGEATIRAVKHADLPKIKDLLLRNGFDLIEDRSAKIVERIKESIITYVRSDATTSDKNIRLTSFLAQELESDYSRLSALFSDVENTTIEHFAILQRIEFAKELLRYGELTLSEIAYRLGYSSVQHLSNQFRRITGLTPTHFRTARSARRTPLDRVS